MPDPRRSRLIGRRHFIDLSPFRASPAFTRMWIGSTLAGLGGQLTIVAVMLHVYDLTGSTFAVAMIAVAGLLPMVVAGIYGGMLADAFDRRIVALVAAAITFGSTVLLAVLAWTQGETVGWLYALSVVNAAANSIVMATRQAIVPRLIPRELLPAASALNGITVGIMVMVGPALAGVLVAFTGYAWTYTLDVVLMSAMFLGLWTLPALRPEGTVVRPGWESLRDGWRFLRRAPNIRLQGVFIVVVAGGPRVGALYAGTLATLTALWFPPLLGGMAIIAIVALLVRASPRFRAYDADHPSP
jgi:MFS family permease